MNASNLVVQKFFFVALCLGNFASSFIANAESVEPLPMLEDLEIYSERIARGTYRQTLQFHTCKETQETDWNITSEIKEAEINGTKAFIAVISLVPKAPLNCKSEFKTEYTYPKISFDLSTIGLDHVFKIIVKNPSEVSIRYDDEF